MRIVLVIIYTILALNVKAQVFNIMDFGARPDGITVNTKYIQKAIDSCASIGGRTVLIPTGTFITGTIELRSNIELYLSPGGVLKGSPNIDDYRPYTSPIFNVPTHYGIIFTHKANNVSITGQGVINGNDDSFFFGISLKK